MAKKLPENVNQTSLDIGAATDKSPNLPEETDFWPQEGETDGPVSQNNSAQLGHIALRSKIENAGTSNAVDKFRVPQLTDMAIDIYPDKFKSKKDLTSERDARIKRMSRDGEAMAYSAAFEIVMGYPYSQYLQLDDEPKYSFDDKSPAYIEQAEAIFKSPYPIASHKRELRQLRSELKLMIPKIEYLRLSGDFEADDSSEDLISFIMWRIGDIDSLLRK